VEIVNERIREYREVSLQISQKEMAEAVGIEYSRFKKIEDAKAEVALKELLAIADKYEVSLDYFLGRRRFPMSVNADESERKMWDMLEHIPQEDMDYVYNAIKASLNITDDDEVTTVCYGKEEKWTSRETAKRFYIRAMAGSEGSEHERYSNIYIQLCMGEKVCRDEVDDDGEN